MRFVIVLINEHDDDDFACDSLNGSNTLVLAAEKSTI